MPQVSSRNPVSPVTASSTKPSPSFDFSRELASAQSTLSIAIGNAEGTRTVDGGKTRAYGGHVDPGNQANNTGTFSYQKGPVSSPEDADAKQLANFRAILPEYVAAAKKVGLDPNNPLLAASFFDSFNQGEAAALGWSDRVSVGKGFLGQLDFLAKKGVTADNIIEARVRSYSNTGGGIEAPGLDRNGDKTTTRSEVFADQARRTDEIVKVLQARGFDASGSVGSPAPGTPAAPRDDFSSATGKALPQPSAPNGSELLAQGASGAHVSALQSSLNAAGAQPPLSVDGDFGDKTKQAIESFQKKNQLPVDGVYGPETAKRLIAGSAGTLNAGTLGNIGTQSFEIKRGSSGPQVKELKQLLKATGFYKGVINDQMGNDGVAALRAAKSSLQIKGDPEIAGPTTMQILKKAAQAKNGDSIPGARVNGRDSTLQTLATARLNEGSTSSCVETVFSNLDRLGIPSFSGGTAPGHNNPREAMVKTIQAGHWQSIPLDGVPSRKTTIVDDIAGTAQAYVMKASDYEKLASAGKVPNGALVFQTRHGWDWNGSAFGNDVAIVRGGGREPFNFVPNSVPLIYGNDTKEVVVLAPKSALS
jgi:peptidoglycan hydrolase-like protein with peptidoglycan-binding domain